MTKCQVCGTVSGWKESRIEGLEVCSQDGGRKNEKPV